MKAWLYGLGVASLILSTGSALAQALPQLMPEAKATNDCAMSYTGKSAKALETIRKGSGYWIQDTHADTVVVFVHGILSNSQAAWLTSSPSCAYWPDLVAEDTEFFRDVDVFVAGYHSDADAGTYTVADAAEELMTALRMPPEGHQLGVLHRKNILFVAHSLGGVVVRQALQVHREEIRDRRIGLVLLGSPTKGSEYADNVTSWLRNHYKNALLDELRTGSTTLVKLDEKFSAWLKERSDSNSEVPVAQWFEARFPGKGNCGTFMFWVCEWVSVQLDPIVQIAAAGDYGSPARRIGDTDHLTLVKPHDRGERVHMALREFFTTRFAGERRAYLSTYGTVKVAGSISTMGWREFGPKSEWVFTAMWPCVEIDERQESSCGPWQKNHGTGFNAMSLRENDIGFVVDGESYVTPKADSRFRFTDTFTPANSVAKFDGKPVYSSLQRVARHDGHGDGVTVKSLSYQPVIYQARAAAHLFATDIPANLGQEVRVPVPARSPDAQIVITSIAGKWSVPVADLREGARYGVLRLEELLRGTEEIVVRFRVGPW